MNILKILIIGVSISAVVSLLLFEVIGIKTSPLNYLFCFLVFVYISSFGMILYSLITNPSQAEYLKLSFDRVIPITILSVLVSLLVGAAVFIAFGNWKNIANFLVVGLFFGLIRGVTIKSRNSVIWCVIILSLTISYFILDSFFLLNVELVVLLAILTFSYIFRCLKCNTWWSVNLINKELLSQYNEQHTYKKTKTARARGIWDRAIDFDITYDTEVPYNVTRKIYKHNYCCQVCGEKRSQELIK